jgi:hypothetical protein
VNNWNLPFLRSPLLTSREVRGSAKRKKGGNLPKKPNKMNEKNKKLSTDPELQSPLKERNMPKRVFTPPKSGRKGSSLESSHCKGGGVPLLTPLGGTGKEKG